MHSSTPQQARDALFSIFPGFRAEWEIADNPHIENGTFGSWVNAAVLDDGPLENAVATGFLEHMHQIRVTKLMRPHLSRIAKEKSHA